MKSRIDFARNEEQATLLSCKIPLLFASANRRPSIKRWHPHAQRTLRDLLLLSALSDGPKSVGEIRDQTGWDNDTFGILGNATRRLVSEGLIRREYVLRPKRTRIYYLTEAGLRAEQAAIEFCRVYARVADSTVRVASRPEKLACPSFVPLSPEEIESRFRVARPDELSRVLDLPGVLPEFRRISRAIQAWPLEDLSRLFAVNIGDVDHEARFLFVQQENGKQLVEMAPDLRAVVAEAVAARKAAPLFRSRRGFPWTYHTLRHDQQRSGTSAECALFLRARECKVLRRVDLVGLRFSDVDLEAHKIWVARRTASVPSYFRHKTSGQARVRIEGKDHYLGTIDSAESWARYHTLIAGMATKRAAVAHGEFLRVLRDAVALALSGPLFETAHAARWNGKTVAVFWAGCREKAQIQQNVQFPGTRKMRAAILIPAAGAGAASERRDELILYTRDRAPEIGGVAQPFLNRSGDQVVRALVAAGIRGLTKDQLAEKSGCGDARGILTRLRKSSPAWKSVIEFPGESGRRGYRIRGVLAEGNGHPH
jgi:DNA-binding MarR family transcriptional regulator